MENVFNIISFGAKSDGKTDCTKAIQSAIDAASKVSGKVYIPSGVYKCGQIKMRPYVTLEGEASWTYRENGGSILFLNDEKATCLLDITEAYGCAIRTLCLDGNRIGENIHGIATIRKDDEKLIKEDTTLIDGCRIASFSGDGVHMQRIWCFSLRHSQLVFNKGNGLYIMGWDAFIIDNWFSNNDGAGVCSDKEMSAIIFTGNRVEWNVAAGFKFINPCGITITGNAFDASGGPAIDLNNPKGTRSFNVVIVGNSFTRSGMPMIRTDISGEKCHLHIERAINCIVQSNSFFQGVDDGGNNSNLCPETGIIIKKLKNCTVKDNAMTFCATKNVYIDRGEHEGENKIEISGTLRADRGNDYIFPFFDD